MAGTSLSIKLRCGSWQQLATIYRRDLSRGSMFLKASTQPPVGTLVRIDLELPSATIIELSGVITQHVVDPQRGTGVDLKLEPLPTKSVWLIESALAADNKVRAAAPTPPVAPADDAPRGIADGEDVASAEQELVRALESEADSLRKLNPFLILGVGYETTDADVRAAFGELTKRYHPDRFARYQSAQLRQIAAEIFILIRDAYRKLADSASRAQVVSTLAKIPTRASTQPRGSGSTPSSAKQIPRVAVPPPAPPKVPQVPPPVPPKPNVHDIPTAHRSAHEAPTHPSLKSAELAHTELAKADSLSIPVYQPEADHKSGPISVASQLPAKQAEQSGDAALETMMDEGKLEEAIAGYRALAKKHPQDRTFRAGIELCEGLRALANRDRMEAAQRFESALEIDPSNERAARELADMRRQATNERKGLLSRLMGKKEGPP